jgi:RNA polymerase sigma-70 factor (ECF subfamily)
MSNLMKSLMRDASDEKLLERARKNEPGAYAELIRRYQERIYRTIFRFTRNHGDTDDLAQETFLRAFQELRRFRGKSGFYTWIYRIAVNQSLNFIKRKKREMGREEFDERVIDQGQPPAFSPEAASESKEFQECLNEAVDSLPLAYRSSFVLVVFEGLSHVRAAQVLGCSESTVSWRLHKARKMLLSRLRPYLSASGR